jgi:GNAT superfamily N-acetyltransferase
MTMSNALTINGVIRPLKQADLVSFIAHLLRLDVISRHDRFQAGLSDMALMLYGEKALTENAIIYGYYVDGVLRAAAELKTIGDINEMAFSVEKTFQNHGIGGALLSRMLLVGRNLGLTTLRLSFMPSNQAMRHVASKFNAHITSDFDQAYAVFKIEPYTNL